MKRQQICLILWTLCGWAWAQPAAGPPGHPPLISVTGKGEIWVAPDQIEFSVHLQGENADPEAAMASSQKLLEQLRRLLADYSLETGSFQVTDVSLERPFRNGVRQKVYEASRECSFTLANVKQKDSLLLAFARGDLGEVRSTRASLKNPIPLREKARLQALEEARRKAQLMAGCLQQNVGKAYWIEEVTPEFWSNPSSNIVTRSAPEDGGSGLGMVRVQATVKVAFALSQ
ncbi:SIMPL domain-containing protein [bacterium]|nr:SIMPL domain-containing protein [bacterium]